MSDTDQSPESTPVVEVPAEPAEAPAPATADAPADTAADVAQVDPVYAPVVEEQTGYVAPAVPATETPADSTAVPVTSATEPDASELEEVEFDFRVASRPCPAGPLPHPRTV